MVDFHTPAMQERIKTLSDEFVTTLRYTEEDDSTMTDCVYGLFMGCQYEKIHDMLTQRIIREGIRDMQNRRPPATFKSTEAMNNLDRVLRIVRLQER